LPIDDQGFLFGSPPRHVQGNWRDIDRHYLKTALRQKRSRCVPFRRQCPMLDLLGAATSRLRISLSKSLRVLASPVPPRVFHPILLDHPKPLLILSRTNPDLVPKQSSKPFALRSTRRLLSPRL